MNYRVELLSSITSVNASEWDDVFRDQYPFTRYHFLLALEQGRSIGPQTGWHPQYAVVRNRNSELVAIMPWFKKTHSYGEYFFDWAFAEAYQRYGFRYYPKLVNAIPFTPCSGPRLGLAAEVNVADVLGLIESELLKHHDVSNLQSLYVSSDLSAALHSEGWWQRFDIQFLWHNRNYRSFDDFLLALVSRKRKSIRKERRRIADSGITMKTLPGEALDDSFWQQFSHFYQRTYIKRSGHEGYLTPATLRQWGQQMADQIVVFGAYRYDQLIAASLCFVGLDTLYGRYWGCVDEMEFLHFEACYYQGIAYCIDRGLTYFDAGAQGEHKLHRGFEPVLREGFYRFQPSPMNDAIAQFCAQERLAVAEHLNMLSDDVPLKEGSQ